jgi:hypothetical protein
VTIVSSARYDNPVILFQQLCHEDHHGSAAEQRISLPEEVTVFPLYIGILSNGCFHPLLVDFPSVLYGKESPHPVADK